MSDLQEEVRKLLSDRSEYSLNLLEWVCGKMTSVGIPEDYIEKFRSNPKIKAIENVTTDGQRLVISHILAIELVAYSLNGGNTLNERYLLTTNQPIEGWMVSLVNGVLPTLKKLIDDFRGQTNA